MSKIITLIIGVFLCTSFVQAQSVQVSDTLVLDGITVTASKIPVSLRETTKPVTIIDQAIISRSSGKSISQLLDEQAGIIVNGGNSNPGLNKNLYVQGAAAKYTLFLIDGLAVQDPNGLGGASDLRNISLDNVERIEVVKGSMSTLYGTDAIAGVVNIITKKPQNDDVAVNGNVSYGSFNTLKTGLGVNGTVDGGSYSINYSREETDGISEAEDDTGISDYDDDGFTRNTLNIEGSINPTEGLSVTPFLAYSGFEGDYDAGSFADAANTYESFFFNPGLRAAYSNGALNINAGYNATISNYSFISEFFTSEYEGLLQNFDTYASYELTNTIQTVAGFNYQNLNIGGDGNSVENPNAEIYSPYLNFILNDWNNLSAEAGVRLNSHSEFGSNTTFGVSGSYTFTPALRVISSIGTGFRAPTLLELFGPFGANPNLDPESSTYFNIGLESFVLENSLKLSVNYFNRTIDDVIIYTTGYINQDKQQDSGVEASFNFILNNQVSLNGFYNYLTGELTSLDDVGNTTTSNNLLRRPKHNIGFGVSVNPTRELNVSLNGSYLTKRTDLFFNTLDFSSSEVDLDPYFLLNIYAEYKLLENRFTVFLDARNLTDTDYNEVYGFSTPGLNASGGIRFNFN